MTLDDEQFKELLATLSMRDMLIRIDENTKNAHENFTKHVVDDVAFQAIITKSVEKVHTRLDNVKVDFDKSWSFQNKMMGAIAVLVFVVPIAVAYFKH